jgi:hypothetical protein
VAEQRRNLQRHARGLQEPACPLTFFTDDLPAADLTLGRILHDRFGGVFAGDRSGAQVGIRLASGDGEVAGGAAEIGQMLEAAQVEGAVLARRRCNPSL